MRKIITIVAGQLNDLREHGIDLSNVKIDRLWTVYDKKMMFDCSKFNIHTGKPVKHIEEVQLNNHEGLFLEDNVHDYRVKRTYFLDYYSRVVKVNEKVEVLLELSPSNEIEKKYIIDSLPSDLHIIEKTSIKQYYLSITDNMEERVRKVQINNKSIYTHTVKKGKGLLREEKERNISENKFKSLLEDNSSIPIIKNRMKVLVDDHIVDIDIYENYKSPLIVAEVEFLTEDEAHNYQKPEWFGEEVTENKSYKNQSLWKDIQM